VVRTGDRAAYSTLTDSIGRVLKSVRALGLRPVIVCHDDRDVTVAQQIFPEEEVFFSNYVEDVIGFYDASSMVVGSRLHASILASGMGKPFLNINLDVRGKGFTETFGLSDWNLGIDNPNLVPEIEQRIKTVLAGDLSVFEGFSRIRESFRARYVDFMHSVAETIVSGPGKRG
jgi:polysaccharide pyruvyl transferase WcaK-like protein